MRELDADIVVVGLGALGSQALWRLAQRGHRVLGLDRFHPGHVHGSSHGHTRLFRVACREHPGLVPVAQRSLQLWRELEVSCGRPLLDVTGGVMIGPADSPLVTGSLEAARRHDLAVSTLGNADLRERFPQHAELPGDHIGVWDPLAGIVRPEAGTRAAVDAATGAGAHVPDPVAVTAVEPATGGVLVRTGSGTLAARQAVLAAGPWLGTFAPGLPLRPIRTPMTWFAPADTGEGTAFGLDRLTIFIRQLADGTRMWGHGAVDGLDAKIGPSDDPAYRETDPDAVDRDISPTDHALVSDLVRRALPGLDPRPSRITTCLVTRTPDEQFVLGRPGGDPRLVLAGGCSGHAFKHAPGLGEAIAQLISDERPYTDLSFLDPGRFR